MVSTGLKVDAVHLQVYLPVMVTATLENVITLDLCEYWKVPCVNVKPPLPLVILLLESALSPYG